MLRGYYGGNMAMGGGERLLYEEGKSYYKKGEIWLYSRISPGERLLYSQFSGGKATI